MMKLKLVILIVFAVIGISIGDERIQKEVTLEELDEITGGGILDDKIRLWDEAPKSRNGINIKIKSGNSGNSAQYILQVKPDEVSMK